MIRAVVFDLWNTLVHDPRGNPFQQVKGLLREDQQDQFAAFMQDGMRRTSPDRGTFVAAWRGPLRLDADQERSILAIFDTAQRDARLYPETGSALARTRELARLALLSNTQSFDMDLLQSLGLAEHFRVKGLSAELGHLKPEAEAFEAMQRKLALFPGNLVMVGDSWRDDVEGALRAGWTAIWVNRKGQIRPEHDPEAELVEVQSLDQVPEVIGRLQAGMRCSTCLG